MLLRLLILISLLTISLTAAPSQSKAMRELAKNATYQEGAKAMDGQLADIAIQKFRTVLDQAKLGEDARAYTSLALAEALIRSSLSQQGTRLQAEEALKILNSEKLAEVSSAVVWKAEALASLGRYQEAEAALAEVPKTHAQFSETQLARARIQLALNQTSAATATLTALDQSKHPEIRNTANLLAAEIHINLGHFEAAEEALNRVDEQNSGAAKLKEYLNARKQLSEGKAEEAINRFQSLITAPDHLSERIFRACVLGLADAQAASEQNDKAIATLVQYITDHPDSSVLQPLFLRLIRLLPEEVPMDHPTLVKLREWSDEAPVLDNPLYLAGASADAIPIQTPSTTAYSDRITLSLYYRAKLLARSADPNNHLKALALLTRLRAIQFSHNIYANELYMRLSSASLLDTAYLHLKRNQPELATYTLEVMEKIAFSPRLKDQASFLRGLLLAKAGQPKQALPAFNFALESASSDIASAASINAGVMSLLSSNLKSFDKIAASTQDQKILTSLTLERALWKCSQGDIAGRSDLDSFIMAHPDHPRVNEAHLALASACVDISPPDVELAKAHLEIIRSRLTTQEDLHTIARIAIRAEELIQNWPAAAKIAESFIRKFKDSLYLPSMMVKMGEAHYHNEDFNKARRIFQEVAAKYPDSPYKPYAEFYAAMAARLGGTSQAREESISMFQQIIESDHPLATEARIQQSRVLIDLRQYEKAEKTLAPLQKAKDPSIRRAAGVLLADCLHRQGSTDSAKYDQAIAIYNDLLAEKNLPLAWHNRIHFLRGQTYESNKQRGKALDSYIDVIIQADAGQVLPLNEVEWLWFYRCGFKALAMLESDKRWEAAVKFARRIATFKGPRAEEAAKRANNLAKTHMIWED
ncbi:tetratricopeptide repeat protein [Verrucomicrobiaceae bacterium 5K15]|uniref:Tetratricopeptide repeat protein n=1 Tax=Oceaniferula flava TaxID=2800421 RepID=A0AAE2S938_9BACT|nr:tetratricopeptide repeat protein [Oceaniferula flavus]MBK1853878.1 tetratricopeptide repeat protein [Oceaniferula flavus]MBM1135184.1 tetratricopeptide repeat protein [Oceaniferula flavus]